MANFNMAYNGVNRKRHDQDFIYQSDDFSQQSFDYGNKKLKMEGENQISPSRIIHVRNIPAEIDDIFIASLSIPFGFIENLVFIRKNNQALIQMREVSECLEMVDYYSQFIPSIYGKPLFIQYSKQQQHQDLRNNNPNIELLLQQSNEKRQFYLNNWLGNVGGGASEILRILIDNAPNLTINHLVFYKIFCRYGDVVRIVSYTKEGQHHGLVEFSSALPAHVAQLQLNNMNLLGDCGVMRVDFSKVPGPLQVQRQSDKVRDYSMFPLNFNEQREMESPQYNFPLFAVSHAASVGDSQQIVPSKQYNVQPSGSYYESQQPPMAAGGNYMAPRSQINNQNKAEWEYQARNDNHFNPTIDSSDSSIILLTNLNPEKSNPDALFTLFGVYGDVLRVKVMFNKKNTALVQFPNHQQAVTALSNLDGCFLWGKQMHLHLSKTNVIQMPKEDANHGMTKDYSDSPLHRFKKPNSKNFQNIFPPSAVLHLSNLPAVSEETEIVEIFKNAGFNVKVFKYLPSDRKMAMVEFDSIEDAVHALIECQNFKISEKNYLRISFSKIPGF